MNGFDAVGFGRVVEDDYTEGGAAGFDADDDVALGALEAIEQGADDEAVGIEHVGGENVARAGVEALGEHALEDIMAGVVGRPDGEANQDVRGRQDCQAERLATIGLGFSGIPLGRCANTTVPVVYFA